MGQWRHVVSGPVLLSRPISGSMTLLQLGSDLPTEAMLVSENYTLAGATLSGLGSHLGSQ